MKVSQVSIIAVMLVVIAVALAGCTGTSSATPAATATVSTPSGGAPSGSGQAAAVATSSGAGSGSLTAASIFGGMNYEWAEYKMMAGEGADKMTIYMKYNHKTGKCSMRFEMAEKIDGMPSEMDCSSAGAAGGQSANNPNDVKNDVQLVKVGTETVTVPAGTFLADKYTVTSQGSTATYWIAGGKPLLKMEGNSAGESGAVMELNAWG